MAKAIDTGFGPKAMLSPSAWVKVVENLTTRFLYGVSEARSDLSAARWEERSPFNPEDQPTISKIQDNLDYLSKVFSLSPDSTSLIYDHCLHRMDQSCTQSHLSEVDYTTVLMATDCSWKVVMDRILSHISTDIHKEVLIWALDEGMWQRNALRPKI
jgi:hypothetical protein